jgi:hypothetical protein
MTRNINLIKKYNKIQNDQFFRIANDGKIKIRGWGLISLFKNNYLQDVFHMENCTIKL